MNTFDSLFVSDEAKATQGIPVPMGINSKGEDVIFWIAEANNPVHERLQRKYAKALERNRHRPEEQRKTICRIVAESILVNWEGVLDDKGKAVPPTVEAKTEALIKYRKLYSAVLEIALDPANFLKEDDPHPEEIDEDTEKN